MPSKIEKELTPEEVVELLATLAKTPGGHILRVIQEEAQKRQAQQAPQGSPQTMPGLAQPGMGAEQPAEGAPQDAEAAGKPSLAQLFSSLSGQAGGTLKSESVVA